MSNPNSGNQLDGTQYLREIQDFGYLIGLSKNTFYIEFVSENIQELFSESASHLLDQSILNYIDIESELYTVLEYGEGEGLRIEKVISSINYNFCIYHYAGFIYVEFEENINHNDPIQQYHKKAENVLYSKTKKENWQNLIDSVEKLTGYERILIYKCTPDGGIVIAENERKDFESFMDLQFRELDFSPLSKAIFVKKRIHFILDNKRSVSHIISRDNRYIDLTYSELRPIKKENQHILENSPYQSRFCTVIVVNNQIWGYVAGFNRERKMISQITRHQIQILTRVARLNYVNYEADRKLKQQFKIGRLLIELKESLIIEDELIIPEYFLKRILKFTDSDGIALVDHDKILSLKHTPEKDEILRIRDWALLNQSTEMYYSDTFYKNYKEELQLSPKSGGVMFTFLDPDYNYLIIWFRKIKDHTKKLEKKIKHHPNLHPDLIIQKHSLFDTYEEWKNHFEKRSVAWKDLQVQIAKEFINIITQTINVKSLKIKELYHQLKEINTELDSFSYTISHDLRTPLTVMKLNCQMLERSLSSDERKVNQVKNIIGEIDRLANMMHEILMLSKAKKSEIVLQEIDTKELLTRIIEEAKVYNECPHTIVEIKDLIPIKADKTMAYEIFLNVMNNAIKYSSKQETPKVIVQSYEEKQEIVYKITDNGIGIKSEDHSKMFKLFSRMSNTDGYKGSGVGMSIVYRMMQRLDGAITFESELGKGTTFILRFKK